MSVRRYFEKNRVLVGILLVFYLASISVALVKALYFNLKEEPMSGQMIGGIVTDILVSNGLVVIFYVLFITLTTRYFFRQKASWGHIFAFHFTCAILSGLFAYGLIFIVFIGIGRVSLEAFLHFKHVDGILSIADVNFLYYFALFGIVYTYHFIQQYREAELKSQNFHNQLLASKLQLIRSQLEPHFLFNALNTISSLIHTEPDKATNTISDLGAVLRETLLFRDVQFITVEQELAYLHKYINILKARFEGQIRFEVQLDGELENHKLPALLLQPLVENAVKHGLKGRHNKIDILLCIRQDADRLKFSVKNSGRKMNDLLSEKDHLHKGLDIVRERLELIYGDAFVFFIKNIEAEKYNVEALIDIPLA